MDSITTESYTDSRPDDDIRNICVDLQAEFGLGNKDKDLRQRVGELKVERRSMRRAPHLLPTGRKFPTYPSLDA